MNTREFPSIARRRLADAPASRRIISIYAGILTGLAVLVTLATWLLDLQINKTGGLSSLGLRTTLSAVRSMLPLLQSAVVMCLTLGYRAAMLRSARGQYASPQTLRLGFARFWVLLRCSILEGLIILAAAVASTYLATMIFMLTPLSAPFIEILTPAISGAVTVDPSQILTDELMAQLAPSLLPMSLIFLAVFGLLSIPILLRYRMTDYVIIDRPDLGAFAAMRESRRMMRWNCLSLIGLDFRLWWYYLALTAASVLCYADQLLPLVGVQLPLSRNAAYYGFFALYLAAQFAIYYYLSNRVEVCYSLAYDAIRPREEPDGGVVLGNIFQM